MSFSKITVITPSYNQVDYIEELIDTILEQGDVNLEYMIIDGGSSDGTLEIIKKYEKYIDHWVSESDNGQSHAINKGLTKANGDIVNWINSDDFLEEGALEKIQKAFENPSVNVFIGKSNIVENGKILRQSRGTDVYSGNLSKTIGRARIDQPETWWRKSVIDEIGPLNENLHYTMDRDWWVKYLLRYGLQGVKKEEVVLANFRLHDASKTVSQNSAFNQERNNYYRSLARFYGLKDQDVFLQKTLKAELLPMTDLPASVDLDVLNEAYHYFYLLLADEYYVKGEHHKVRQLLAQINISGLAEEDQMFHEKLRRRSKLPATFIRIARKWKN